MPKIKAEARSAKALLRSTWGSIATEERTGSGGARASIVAPAEKSASLAVEYSIQIDAQLARAPQVAPLIVWQ